MFHRIIFLSLIVSSFSCNFNRLSVPFCFHRSWTSLAGVLKNVARIKHFIRLHIVITETIKKQKNNNNNFVIMLKRNSILKSSFKHSTTLTARPIEMRTSWPYGWFWKCFERFRLKPTIDRPEYWLSAVCLEKLWNTSFCPRSLW